MEKKHDPLAKLRSMGMIIPEPKIKANLENRPKSMTEKFHGYWKESQAGKVFIFDKSFQYDHCVGDIQIEINKYANVFNYLQKSANRLPKQNRIAFIDIETSNLGFGSGSIVFLIGICYFKTESVFTRLLFIDSPANEAALINEFDNLINSFDVICSYNGKSFDVPFFKEIEQFSIKFHY